MKILVVNTVSFELNGITAVIMNYFCNIEQEEIQMDFVVINDICEKYRSEIEKRGSCIYQLPRNRRPVIYAKELFSILIKEKYNAIHIHGNSATMAIETVVAWLARIPVRIVHAHNTSCTYIKMHKILYPFFSTTYTHAFACGDKAGKWLYKDKPFVVLRNGIDLKKYAYSQKTREIIRKQLNVNEKVVIGHVGNFVSQKNHSFLLDVFAKLLKVDSRYCLLLIGDGPLMEEMKKKAYLLGIQNQIIFLGRRNNVYEFLQAMDFFAFPSHYEGMPVALVEAQAAGLPSIVSDNVDKEADLTDSIRFISNEDSKYWVDEIRVLTNKLYQYNREEKCAEWQEKISISGYDIETNAKVLKSLYFTYVKNKSK